MAAIVQNSQWPEPERLWPYQSFAQLISMPKQFTGLGISLLYPDSWVITEDTASESRQGISLESPGGSFMSISLLSPEEDADEAIDEAAEAMNAEYDEVESEPFETIIAGVPLEGTIQRFYYLDFVIVSKLFTISGRENQFLIQIQGEDRDMDQQAAVFDAILTSMFRSFEHDYAQDNP